MTHVGAPDVTPLVSHVNMLNGGFPLCAKILFTRGMDGQDVTVKVNWAPLLAVTEPLIHVTEPTVSKDVNTLEQSILILFAFASKETL